MVALLRSYSTLSQIGASTSLKMLGMKPFLHAPVKEFLYGYKSVFAKLTSIAVDLGLSNKKVRLGIIEEVNIWEKLVILEIYEKSISIVQRPIIYLRLIQGFILYLRIQQDENIYTKNRFKH